MSKRPPLQELLVRKPMLDFLADMITSESEVLFGQGISISIEEINSALNLPQELRVQISEQIFAKVPDILKQNAESSAREKQTVIEAVLSSAEQVGASARLANLVAYVGIFWDPRFIDSLGESVSNLQSLLVGPIAKKIAAAAETQAKALAHTAYRYTELVVKYDGEQVKGSIDPTTNSGIAKQEAAVIVSFILAQLQRPSTNFEIEIRQANEG